MTLQVQGEPGGGERSSAARSQRVGEEGCQNEAAERCLGAQRQVSRGLPPASADVTLNIATGNFRVMEMAALRDSQVRAEQSFRSRQRSTAARGHRERKFLSNSHGTFISFSTLGPPQLRLRLHVNLQHVSPSSSGTPWRDDEAGPESQVEKSNSPRRELCDQVALSFFFFFPTAKLFEMCSRKSGGCLGISCQTQRRPRQRLLSARVRVRLRNSGKKARRRFWQHRSSSLGFCFSRCQRWTGGGK